MATRPRRARVSAPSVQPVATAPLTKLLLTVDEAAQVLGMGRSTLYPKIMRGEIRSVKNGAKRVVPVWELEAFVRRLQETQVA